MRSILILFFGVLFFSSNLTAQTSRLKGSVLDQKTKKPIPYCHIYVENTSLGTVANSEGEFALKIPEKLNDKSLIISSMGYATARVPIAGFDKNQEIKLEPIAVIMDEFVTLDPVTTLETALSRVAENYSLEKKYMSCFYRETVKKNKEYMDIAQGILHVMKEPYKTNKKDQVSVYKGFRSKQYDSRDTLTMRLQGGPNNLLLLDVAKYPEYLFGPEIDADYEFTYEGTARMDDMKHHQISFKRKEPSPHGIFEGTIFIESESYGISKLVFGFSEFGLEVAKTQLIKKKPINAKVSPKAINYEVKYRKYQDQWVIHYARSVMAMKANWKKRLFNSIFYATSEMVITSTEDAEGKKFEPTTKLNILELFSDRAQDYYDQEYWEEFLIIQPEEDILEALNRMNLVQ